MLGHILNNDPRVGYAHQSNLIGPAQVNGADYGYTLLALMSNMLSQYNAYYNANAPLTQMTDVTSAPDAQPAGRVGHRPTGGRVTASVTNGVVTVTNGGSAVNVPSRSRPAPRSTAPPSAPPTAGRSPAGRPLASSATETLAVAPVAPTITSSTTATSIVGRRLQHDGPHDRHPHRTASPRPVRCRPVSRSPTTATAPPRSPAPRPPAAAGSYPITITATNSAGTTTQTFTLTNARGADHHQPRHGDVQHRGRGHLHGHHHRLPGGDAHRVR